MLPFNLPKSQDKILKLPPNNNNKVLTALFSSHRSPWHLTQFSSAVIEADTQIAAASQQATVIRTKADTEANATITQGEAEANTIITRATNLVSGYQSIQTNLTTPFNPSELLAYAWIQALASTGAKLTFNIQKPAEITL